ncbi:MAG: RIP metalloprotease RseP [Bacteriovoracaceae bacterium]|jgi:regulator of sigma E protease|nr:RIP metalloprotease RseP [Bacteriovoracaceae bacterium]
MIEKFIIFIVFLCPIIFFHELGHFLFARLFGVRVEVFSLGFGPKLFKKKIGETEYAFSLFPLGGYVKMFGEDPYGKEKISEEDKKYAFNHKGKWARFWIVFGGPLANFVFTYFLFAALLMTGEKVPNAKFGYISEQSYFHKQGFRTADHIIKVNGTNVNSILDFPMQGEDEIIKSITVKRDGGSHLFAIGIPFKIFSKEFSELERVFRRPLFVSKDSRYFVVTNKKGELNWENSIEELAASSVKSFFVYPVTEMNGDDAPTVNFAKELHFSRPEVSDVQFYQYFFDNQLFPADLQIKSIVTESPAEKSNLKKDEIIVGMGGKPLFGFSDLRTKLQDLKDHESINISYYSDGVLKNVDLTPEVREVAGRKVKAMGVYSSVKYVPPKLVNSGSKGFFESFYLAFGRTWDSIIKTVSSFKKLITGSASLKNLGGPIAIGKAAADSFYVSLSYFFNLMALISVNLGVINLFPIPVLDGGHIFFIFIEIFNRGPLSRRKMEIAQQFGLSMILLLIFAAFANDIYRVFF